MKKFFFSLIGVLLLSTSAFGSDRVLFKMVMTNTSSQSVAATTAQDLSSYAFFIGGSGEIYNGQGSAANVIYAESSTGYSRLTNTSGYLHITLSRALRASDVISYTNGSKDSNKILVTTTSTRGSGGNIEPNGTGYTIPAASAYVGATELYFWYGSNINSTTYIHSLTITTSSEEVVYYDFENETTGEFSQVDEVTLNNGLKVNSSLPSGRSSIVANSVAGYTKALNIAGNGINRALKLSVTDPCTIEVWAIGAAKERSLLITDDSSDLDKYTLYTTTDENKTSLVRSTHRFEGTADNTTFIISPSTGGWKIVAIRVIYDRIRPAAGLTVSPASVILRAGESQLFTFNKDHSSATITRSAGEGSESAWIKKAAEDENVSITMQAKADGVGHTYVMRLTQNANAYCRTSVVDVPIRIVGANESVNDVAWNSSYVSKTSYVWKNDENVTLIQNTNEATFNNNADAIGEFAAGTGLRLAAGREYTLSVPSNKQIARVTFSGYTAQTGTGSIKVNGVASEFNAYDAENPVIKDIVYENINAQSFTFEAYNRNIIVKIDLVTSDLGYYPVTISKGWASFCAPEDVELPEGVYAYVADMIQDEEGDKDVLVINKVESSSIPANTGVLLYSETVSSCHLTATTGAPAIEGTNLFIGTVARTANPNTTTTYGLNSSAGAFQQYQGNYIPSNKAYLTYETSGSAPARLRMQIGPKQVPTDVDAISNQPAAICMKTIENGQLIIIRDGVKYNVQGQIVK